MNPSHLVRTCSLLSLLSLSACGAKTGLLAEGIDSGRAPDAGTDGGRDTGLDAPFDVGRDAPIDACAESAIALRPIRPEVMFVLDRSTSMSWSLTGPDGPGPTRWSILIDALGMQLPRYDMDSDMGLLLYPQVGGERCSVSTDPALAPAPRNARAVLDRVNSTGPGGRTPTAAALNTALRFFTTHPDPSHVRAVVLATDGAPNCNAALDANRCACTNGAGLPVGMCFMDGTLCLDDVETITAIESLASEGVPTYVVGIDGDPDPALSEVLTRMARAGERPNPLDMARAYYSVRRPEDLSAAFDRIQASIISCTLAFDGVLPSDRTTQLSINGNPVTRDPMRVEGWEFSEDRPNTVTLYGDACVAAREGMPRIQFDILCGE